MYNVGSDKIISYFFQQSIKVEKKNPSECERVKKDTIQNDLCDAGKDESDKRGSEEELNNKTKTKENVENMTISGV